MYFRSDPFTPTDNVVNPLQISQDSEGGYSIKVSVFNKRTKKTQISVYSGKFLSEVYTRAIGFQGVITTIIETVVRGSVASDYTVGSIPKLGKPEGFVFENEDILVSFADRNDFFIFRKNASNPEREVIFVTMTDVVETWNPEGATTPYSFISTQSGKTYSVTYDSWDNFTVDTLVFDTVGSTFTFGGVPLVSSLITNYTTSDTTVYKLNPYTSVGVTVLPTVTVDQTELKVAEGQISLFYRETTPQALMDYINGSYSFTTLQQRAVMRFLCSIFSPVRSCVQHVLKFNNRDYFSINNGFASYAEIDGISLEIKLS